MNKVISDCCYHYVLYRSDIPSFVDKAFSESTLIRRAKKFWSDCTIQVVKVKFFRGNDGSIVEQPVSSKLLVI